MNKLGRPKMKRRIAIAILIGVFISVLLVFPPLQFLGFPGILAVMWIWGPHGPAPDIAALTVMLAVNASVYSLIILGVLSLRANP